MDDITDLISIALHLKHACSPENRGFSEIVKRFQDIVYGYVFALTRDVFLSEDITQDVFILAYQHLEQLTSSAAFPAWIRQIAKRECIKRFRKNKPPVVSFDALGDYKAREKTPDQLYDLKETKHEVRDAIEKLPENQRIPVVLYYIDGYSQKEIADFLCIKLNTVKKRLERGRIGVRKEIEKMVEDDIKRLRPSRNDTLLRKINLYTTFDTAAKNGQITLLEQMIVDGINVNEKDATGKTLLHWAVENNHYEAVVLLLQNKADWTVKDKKGNTCLEYAKKNNNKQIISLLENRKNERMQEYE
jgi:RNA polymerase sigma factor (sigma-70 family)